MQNTEVFEKALETWLEMRKVFNAKKEKTNANHELQKRRVEMLRMGLNSDLAETDKDEKAAKPATVVKYSKTKSHVLEANQYVVTRKVAPEKSVYIIEGIQGSASVLEGDVEDDRKLG